MAMFHRRRSESGIFTGSMADVSFLLLIFFMITSALSLNFGLDLAQPEETPADDRQEQVEVRHAIDISVAASGELRVDCRPTALDQLLPLVREKLEKAPSKPVILRAAPEARYGAMIAVLDELRSAPEKAGFEVSNLVIPTLGEIERYWPASVLDCSG